MKVTGKICRLTIVILFLLLPVACTDPEYTEIKIRDFPEKYSNFDRYPWEMLDLKKFSKAYDKILDDFPDNNYPDDFILELGVVSSGNKFVSTDQRNFIFMAGCKPHFCLSTEIYALYDPANNSVWAYIWGEDMHSASDFNIWLGKPDQKTQNLIEKLIEMTW